MSTAVSTSTPAAVERIWQETATARIKLGDGPGKLLALIIANIRASTGVYAMLVEAVGGVAPENGAESIWSAWVGDKSELPVPVPFETDDDLYLCASSTAETLTLTTAVLRPLGLWKPES